MAQARHTLPGDTQARLCVPVPHISDWESTKVGIQPLCDLTKQGNLTREKISLEFLMSYDNMARPQEVVARDKLLKTTSWHMGKKQPLRQYVQNFRNILREAGAMIELDKIAYFQKGLLPGLNRECLTQPNGKPWGSLEELIDYAQGQEQRIKMQSNTDNDDAAVLAAMYGQRHNNSSRKRGNNQGQDGGGKRAKPDNGGGQPTYKTCNRCKQQVPWMQKWSSHNTKCPALQKKE